MRSMFNGLTVLCAAALLSGSAYGADTPNFNKRGSTDKEEKAFVTEVAERIVKEARSSAKDITLQEYKFKEPKEGHKELTISAGYVGAAIVYLMYGVFWVAWQWLTRDRFGRRKRRLRYLDE